MDEAVAVAFIVLGCPALFPRVAPSRRLLEASLAVGPWHAEAPSHAPMTRPAEPRQGGAAAGPPDAASFSRCRGRPRHVLRLFPRATQAGSEALVPPPLLRCTPPGVAFLHPGGLWPHGLLWYDPRRGWALPALASPARAGGSCPTCGGSQHASACAPAPRPPPSRVAHDDRGHGPARWGSRAAAPHRPRT